MKRQSDSGSEEASPRTTDSGNDSRVRGAKDEDDEDNVDSSEGKDKIDNDDDNNLYDEPKDPPKAAQRASPGASNHVPAISDDDDDSYDDEEDNEESTYSTPRSNLPIKSPPPGCLYTVEATHKYTGEDVDELCFEPGEIIYVITFENPEEQDDGWQMGIKQSDGIKGVFPENFTQRI